MNAPTVNAPTNRQLLRPDKSNANIATVPLWLAFLLVNFFSSAAFSEESGNDLQQGKEIYQSTCAMCHGPGGQPDADSALVKNMGVVPANFSDPLFNSREPNSDWKIVVTHGGPALGFSEQMPAFGESLSEADINSVLAYVKTLGGQHDYPDGKLNMFLPIRTKKAFPEDEWVWKQRYTGQDGSDAWKNTLEYEFRIGQRGQDIVEVTHEIQGDESEFGHFEPGFKYVLQHDARSGYILTGAAQFGVPLNSGANWEFLPYLAFGKILSDEWTLQGSGRLKLDLEDSDASSAEFAGIGLNKRGNIALNVGVELPLNDRDRYEWRGYVYLIWDFADGGFFEGW